MSENTVYFALSDIAQLSGLDRHIRFAQDLIERYRTEETAYSELTERLERIQKKQRDQCLNMAVIGEFSSGKSTFINALLRQQLLSAGVLQGTTVAATVLGYGACHQIELKRLGKKKKVYTFPSLESLQQNLDPLIDRYSAQRDLEQVNVLLPSESLKNGNFRIIDTPGLDATEQWHEEVTVRALRETADLSIILVDAVRPLPDSLCSFISEQLEKMLPQCVFVITKSDLIPPRERNMMMKFVKKTVAARFGVREPVVLDYASPAVINSFAPGSFEPGRYDQDVSVALESEKRLLTHMAEQRTAAQTKKLLRLIDRIYSAVSGQMEQLETEYAQRLALLQRSRQTDLSEFVARQKQQGLERFICFCQPLREQLCKKLEEMARQAQQAILDEVDSLRSKDALRTFVQRRLQDECVAQCGHISRYMVWCLGAPGGVQEQFQTVMAACGEEFRTHFRQLDCLVPEQTGLVNSVKLPMPSAQKLLEVAAYTKGSGGGRRMMGGAAAGAVAGTLVPVVGTLAGAVIGMAAGVWGGPKLQVQKDAVKSKLQEPLKEYFSEVVRELKEQLDGFLRDSELQLCAEMDRYLYTYYDTVDDWLRQEEDRRYALDSQVHRIRDDMSRLEDRRIILSAMETHV